MQQVSGFLFLAGLGLGAVLLVAFCQMQYNDATRRPMRARRAR